MKNVYIVKKLFSDKYNPKIEYIPNSLIYICDEERVNDLISRGLIEIFDDELQVGKKITIATTDSENEQSISNEEQIDNEGKKEESKEEVTITTEPTANKEKNKKGSK